MRAAMGLDVKDKKADVVAALGRFVGKGLVSLRRGSGEGAERRPRPRLKSGRAGVQPIGFS
jgi:hypothetical protein